MFQTKITTQRPRLHWLPGQALLVLGGVCLMVGVAVVLLVTVGPVEWLRNKARGRR